MVGLKLIHTSYSPRAETYMYLISFRGQEFLVIVSYKECFAVFEYVILATILLGNILYLVALKGSRVFSLSHVRIFSQIISKQGKDAQCP